MAEHRFADVRTILSRTSGYILEAGFTHSITPARNCTFGCTFCYVPTMRIQGGLQPEDWRRWGQYTTFKRNAAALLAKELRGGEIIYCSSLVDPYQPGEQIMPDLLRVMLDKPPALLVIQTRSPLVLRDLDLLRQLRARVSFSITTNRADVLRHYEPHSPAYEDRLHAVRTLNANGVPAFTTLAPLLPSHVEELVADALAASPEALIVDPAHNRTNKKRGATTRDVALKIAERRNEGQWFEPTFQAALVEQIRRLASSAGRPFASGPEGFACLARPTSSTAPSSNGSALAPSTPAPPPANGSPLKVLN